MATALISKFMGLDLRRLREVSDPRSARRAVNVDLTLGSEYVARDGLRELMPLHPQSKGLYSLGGTLRAVIPGGQSFPSEAVGPVRVKYDQLGAGDSYYTSVMVAMSNTNTATLEGADWPLLMPGRSITVGGETHVITAVVGREITLIGVFGGSPGLYPFVLSGSPTVLARTVSIVNSTNIAILTNGTWPIGIDGKSFSVPSAGFVVKVVARVSATTLRLDTTLSTGTLTNVDFQLSGLALDYPIDTMIRVAAVESVGANASFGVYPYLNIERWVDAADHSRGRVFEHHWVTSEAPSSSDALATQVRLPFSPGASLIKMGGKLCAADDVNGVVRLSSTANGPTDWITAQDAGYIPVLTHASGDRRIQGLGVYDDKLAVIFQDAVQLWAMDPQPSNITLVRVIGGPGTDHPRSVVNVLGDLFYFTRGGFRSMHMQTVTGQIQQQDDIGGPVDAISTLEADSEVTTALWVQSRGQYLCAFGGRVYAFRYSPKSKVMGWTLWELGIQVDAIVEHSGKTYIRADNKLYVLEAGYDDGSTWEVTFNDFAGKDPSVRKRMDFMEVVQRGTCQVRTYLEPDSDVYYLDGPTLEGTTIKRERVFVGALARTFGVRFIGSGPWTLSALQLQYQSLPW